jgi:cyclopropane-fatty-acyl-phospholipid synthase
MALTRTAKPDDLVQSNLRLLNELFIGQARRQIGVRLWDGTVWPDADPRPAAIVLKSPGALRSMFLPGNELALAEAYLYDDFDIEGDIEKIFDMAEDIAAATEGWRKKLVAARDLLRLPAEHKETATRRGPARLNGQQHSIERDREAVRYHYDVSNDFYALWLDRRMVYSCAYFASPDVSLDDAQAAKLEHICRKLRLQPGQRLLDIGCGWGGMVIHAAQHYGVEATGVTLSQPQADLANQRIREAGLDPQKCRVVVQDYREVAGAGSGSPGPAGNAPYDALVSVGMFEHVGKALLPAYFRHAAEILKPGGLFLNHGIASRATDRPQRGSNFSDAYVFPDGELVPINVTLAAAEANGFEVRDVESLREHYMMTLRHWVRNLEAHRAEALRCVDEVTYRVWRLFMSGSADGFRRGRLNLYQSLLVKPGPHGESNLPLTRADLYR